MTINLNDHENDSLIAPCFGMHYFVKKDGIWACDNADCGHQRDTAGTPIVTPTAQG